MRGSAIWIIDGAYVLKGATGKIDYIALRRQLQDWAGVTFDRCLFFNSARADDRKQREFHNYLEKNHFTVYTYDVKEMRAECPRCEHRFGRLVQAGVDVGICTAILAEKYDTLVLTAGDGDFVDALRVAKIKWRRKVFVTAFDGSLSKKFIKLADQIKLLKF
jgi:uncharacterized LabA/DUF88 family protein